MSFKSFLGEAAVTLKPWMFQTEAEIQTWIRRRHGDGREDMGLTLNPDLTVDGDHVLLFKGDMRFYQGRLVIPVQFNAVKSFSAANCHLDSAEGCPKIAVGSVSLAQNILTSIDGFPTKARDLYINTNAPLKSIKGIARVVKSLNALYIGPKAVEGLLGVLMINGMERLVVTPVDKNDEQKKAIEIINKHLKTTKDPMECQEELISTGLRKFATM